MASDRKLKNNLNAINKRLKRQLEIQKNDYNVLQRRAAEASTKLDNIRAAIDMPELYLDKHWRVTGYSQNFLAVTEMANEFANHRGLLKDFLEEGDFEKLIEYEKKVNSLESLPYDQGAQWDLRYKGPKDAEKIGKEWRVALNCRESCWNIKNGILFHKPHITDRVDCYLMTTKEYGGVDEDIKIKYRFRTSSLKEHIRDLSLVICGSSGLSDALCDRIGYTACTASNENSLARLQRNVADITTYPETLESNTDYLAIVERVGGRVSRYLKNLRTGEEFPHLVMIDTDAIYNYQNYVGFTTFSGEMVISELEIYTRKSRFSIDQFRIPFHIDVRIRDERLAGRIYKLHKNKYEYRGKTKYTLIFEDVTQRRNNEISLNDERARLELSLKHEKLLSEIASRLNSSESFPMVIEDILHALGIVLKFDCTGYYKLEKKGNIIQAQKQACWCKDDLDADWHLNHELSLEKSGFLWKQLYRKEPLVEIGGSNYEEIERLSSRQWPQLVIIPFDIDDKIIGFIILAKKEKEPVSSAVVNLFSTLSDIFVSSIKRDLYFKARIKAERKQAESLRMVEQAAHMASIGVMAAGLTHEINQPLSSIKVTADSVLYWDKRNKGMLPDLFVKKLEKISKEVARVDNIIRHMRSFWISPGRQDSRAVDLNDGVNSSLIMIEQQLHAHEINCKITLHKNRLPIRANQVHVEQIMINLVINAMHALDEMLDKEDKMVKVATFRENNSACLEVTDNGPGLPDKAEQVIFDPFFTTKKKGKGTGLGLAIVKRFVEEHQGTIEAKNEPEGGARFTVKFPLYLDEGMYENEDTAS